VRIFLIGLMGSGKTTIGRRLAARTGWPYVDNDALVRDVAGRTAPEIEDAGGVDALHEAELAAFEHALTIAPPVIIGVAGFVVMDPELRARMRGAGTVVWLRARPETLRTRVGAGGGRRDDATSLDWIRDVVEERSPVFDEAADIAIDVDRLRPRLVVEEIVQRLGIEPDQAEASATSSS
jgi:shikimate kinase